VDAVAVAVLIAGMLLEEGVSGFDGEVYFDDTIGFYSTLGSLSRDGLVDCRSANFPSHSTGEDSKPH
jgi:hypothetical protein